jgi:hypothetical protein
MKDAIFEIVHIVLILVASVFLICVFAHGVLSLYKHANGEDPASEYRALCIKSEGKPVFNGKYWECMK